MLLRRFFKREYLDARVLIRVRGVSLSLKAASGKVNRYGSGELA